jgi:uracil-DNA glycosylase
MVNPDVVMIHASWKQVLSQEFHKPYFDAIKFFLQEEKRLWHIVYPLWGDIFNAFNQTPFDEVKVVILWQDPYHGAGEAHWLCFSVQDWVKQPPSLKNIFKELASDIVGFSAPLSWNLVSWAQQGVFLLNSTLTVRKDAPNSHKDIGWQQFTDAVIKKISDDKENIVFLLRWSYAQSKIDLIDTSKHFVLQSAHPSPFSAYKWFFWSQHFSQTNNFLQSKWKKSINWFL